MTICTGKDERSELHLLTLGLEFVDVSSFRFLSGGRVLEGESISKLRSS